MSSNNTDIDIIKMLIKNSDDDAIRVEILRLQAADIAEILALLDDEDHRLHIFELIDSVETRAETLLALDETCKDEVIQSISAEKLSKLVEEMASDDAADFLSELDNEVLNSEILAHVDKDLRDDLNRLQTFDEESGGGIMTSELCAFPSNMRIQDVLKNLHPDTIKDPIMYVYVLDAHSQNFYGTASLVHLINANPSASLASITEKVYIWAELDEDREKIAAKFRKYNLWVMPVLDKHNQLVGRITVDDILDISIEEADEDIAKMTGTPDLISHENNLLQVVKLRLPWLIITLLLALTNAFVIGHFLKQLETIVVLAAFPTVIAAMGGNTGMQSATVFIRELALDKILPTQFSSIAIRECLSGLIMGGACGLIAGCITYFGIPLLFNSAPSTVPVLTISKIIFLSITFAMTFAGCFGTLIPITLRKLSFDPAVAAGPFVTTLNDIISSVIYFMTATALIQLAS
jgi:magnesium transporter